MKVGYKGSLLKLTASNNRDRAMLNRLFHKGVWTQRLALDSRELDVCPMPKIEDIVRATQ